VPKQVGEHGLDPQRVRFEDDAIREVVERYTREAGVRNLEREIASICRKLARKKVADGSQEAVELSAPRIVELLGVPRYPPPRATPREPEIGAVIGLAWTEHGGEILDVEATLMRGRGRLSLTGQLGEVMQESAQAAMSWIRSRAERLGIDPLFHRRWDVHVHLPEGAIPKDGPSAGIALATALVSLLAGVAVRQDVAMTGEITLRGKVLPIGGVKEKVLAAYRYGARTIVLPKENEKDLDEVPEDVRGQLEIRLVETMDEVLEVALAGELPAIELADADEGGKPRAAAPPGGPTAH